MPEPPDSSRGPDPPVERISTLFSSFVSSSREEKDERSLAQPLEYYTDQAVRFADFVVQLLRMRGVGMGVFKEPRGRGRG